MEAEDHPDHAFYKSYSLSDCCNKKVVLENLAVYAEDQIGKLEELDDLYSLEQFSRILEIRKELRANEPLFIDDDRHRAEKTVEIWFPTIFQTELELYDECVAPEVGRYPDEYTSPGGKDSSGLSSFSRQSLVPKAK